jgi:hypothetical protein
MEVSGQLNAPAALPTGKERRYPMENKRWGKSQSRFRRYEEENNFLYLPESKLDSSAIQSVAYTD